jgi:hypothetical protein
MHVRGRCSLQGAPQHLGVQLQQPRHRKGAAGVSHAAGRAQLVTTQHKRHRVRHVVNRWAAVHSIGCEDLVRFWKRVVHGAAGAQLASPRCCCQGVISTA